MIEFIGPCTPIKEIYLKTNIAPQCAHRRMILGQHFQRAYMVDSHDVIRVEMGTDNESTVVVLVPLHKVEHILLDSEPKQNASTEEHCKQPSKPVRRRRKASGDSKAS